MYLRNLWDSDISSQKDFSDYSKALFSATKQNKHEYLLATVGEGGLMLPMYLR